MAKQNDAGDAAVEETAPAIEPDAPLSGETEAQAPVAEQPADAPVEQPVAAEQPVEARGEQNDAGALTAEKVKAMISESLAPIMSRLDALEKTADTNEVNKLAGRLRQVEHRMRGFF